eukprot:TRINITY_DN101658_c0_g1_i1.p1 TRINITY_DN101658_c0_g1~~TRINITY_DN101658_c0_g1_i1.p1  ORF type:complete len:477 (-),score=102.91 TRINITY_DN101658_c0_g1_i1:115-1545(-)
MEVAMYQPGAMQNSEWQQMMQRNMLPPSYGVMSGGPASQFPMPPMAAAPQYGQTTPDQYSMYGAQGTPRTGGGIGSRPGSAPRVRPSSASSVGGIRYGNFNMAGLNANSGMSRLSGMTGPSSMGGMMGSLNTMSGLKGSNNFGGMGGLGNMQLPGAGDMQGSYSKPAMHDPYMYGTATPQSYQNGTMTPVEQALANRTPSTDVPIGGPRPPPTQAPDFVLDPMGWYKYHDHEQKGLTQEEFTELILGCYRNADPNAVQEFLRRQWPAVHADGSDVVMLEHFIAPEGWRAVLLRHMGDPPLPLTVELAAAAAKVEEAEEKEVQDDGELPRPGVESGKVVRTAPDNFGQQSKKKLQPGVMGVNLPDGRDVQQLLEEVPAGVRALLVAKHCLPIYRSFINAVIKTPRKMKGELISQEVVQVIARYRPQFEGKGVCIYACQAPAVTDKLFKWIEFVDKGEKPLYQPSERMREGSDACSVM